MKYETRNNKYPLKTNILCGRGFIRELKSLITGIEPSCDDQGGYSDFESGLQKILNDTHKQGINSISDSEKQLLQARKYNLGQLSQIGKSVYSSWWNGKTLPNSMYKTAANELFSGLAEKWLSRKGFKNRLQIHLTALDFFELRHIDSEENMLKQARYILNVIAESWYPEKNSFCNYFDIQIYGPKNRTGFDPGIEQLKQNAKAFNKNYIFSPDPRGNIKYDLSICRDSLSSIGLNLPQWLVNVYRTDNDLSIIPFMYLLINLELESDSNYMPDLILDFLTAFICGFLITNYDGSRIVRKGDTSDEFFESAGGYVRDYFFANNPSLSDEIKKLKNCNNLSKTELANKYVKRYWGVNHHPCYYLHYQIREIFRQYHGKNFWHYVGVINKQELANFNSPDFSDHMNRCKFHTVNSHQKFRDIYFRTLRFSGWQPSYIGSYLDDFFKTVPISDVINPVTAKPKVKLAPYNYGIKKISDLHL